MTTAVVGAGVVAFGFGSFVPDAKEDPARQSTLGDLDAALNDRSEVLDRASRAGAERGGLATSIAQAAPDLWLLPLYGYQYSSAFGYRWGANHNGIDLAAPLGTTIYSVHAGTVTHSAYTGGYGYLVIVEHEDGAETLYAHASELYVYEGQEVTAGEPLAAVGNTGNSFGPHLHFEVHVDGTPLEPIAWMAERGVDVLSETEEIYRSAGG